MLSALATAANTTLMELIYTKLNAAENDLNFIVQSIEQFEVLLIPCGVPYINILYT